MKKFLSIQALRGIAVLSVIAFHCLPIEQKYSGGDFLLPAFFRLGQSGVDLFFVLSGFVMVTVTTGRFGRQGEMMRFIWGRFTRIYPTYWFYFCITAAIFIIKPNWVNASQGHQTQFLSSFLLMPSNQLPLVMVAWSLIHELWFYLVFAVLLKFQERLLLPALLVWAAIITVVNLFVPLADLPASARVALHPYTLEFIIGALVALFVFKGPIQKISATSAALMVAAVLAIGLPIVYSFDLLKQEGLLRVGVVGVLYGLLVLAVMTLEKLGKFTVPSFLQFLGDISYTLYLSHILVLSAIGRLWLLTSPKPDSLIDNFLAFLLMFGAVVGYGWVAYRLTEQPVLKLSHRLRARWFAE